MSTAVEKYIKENIGDFVRECKEGKETLMALPFPFSIPSQNHFEELYYWDTYFTNLGYIVMGDVAQAKNNTDDMLYIVEKYGFMPNASRTTFLTRSQPPFLSLMVMDIFKATGDRKWLFSAYKTLKKEHEFWQTKRMTRFGLNSYHGTAEAHEADYLAERYFQRTGLRPDMEKIKIGEHMRLSFESGWDNNPRWDCHGFDFLHIDLNSILYIAEKTMGEIALILQNGEEELWFKKAEQRQELLRKYMKTEKGYFTDYNFKDDYFGRILSAASFYPLFAGAANEEEAAATVDELHRLEQEYGISACEKSDIKGNFQWNYPNGWAPHQYLVYRALKNYGYDEEAKRVAKKYITLVEKVFEETGALWEKYNVADGNIEVNTESPMPTMMGWSAGVYLALKKEIKD